MPELFSNDDVCQVLRERLPGASDAIDDLILPGYKNLEHSVLEDIQLVKSSPLIRKALADRTRGYIYDIRTGEVRPVETKELSVRK
ncbi:hypothetical protein HJFPF1_09822 [Paramyrothecium foliicola]|nr:hypothetical protein HJFPF1_09822 [Paramyrothecium foliicola]